jgi:hypothetical protein
MIVLEATMAKNLYTLAEAAVELNASLAAVRKAADRGTLRTERVGPMRVVTSREIERYRARHLGNVGRPAKPRKRS